MNKPDRSKTRMRINKEEILTLEDQKQPKERGM